MQNSQIYMFNFGWPQQWYFGDISPIVSECANTVPSEGMCCLIVVYGRIDRAVKENQIASAKNNLIFLMSMRVLRQGRALFREGSKIFPKICFNTIATDVLTTDVRAVILQWASCQICTIAGYACAGNAGDVFPRHRQRVSEPDMHHSTCVTHMPWCMQGSLASGFLWSRRRGKRSRHSRRVWKPPIFVSGKRPEVAFTWAIWPKYANTFEGETIFTNENYCRAA